MSKFISMPMILLTALIAFLIWAGLFEIDETVRARGKIVAEGHAQVIQSPDGGVLRALEVAEGDPVRAGQVLAVMDSTAAAAAVDEILSEIETNEIARLRAMAELAGVPPDFGALADRYPQVAIAQQALFDGNMAALASERNSAQGQVDIAQDQVDSLRALQATGDVSRSELARAERELLQAQSGLEGVVEKYRASARKDVAAIEQEIATLQFRLEMRKTALGYTQLTAPTDGIISQLKTNTLGAVLRAGDELMRISPTGGSRLAEVQIAPMNIGSLRDGQDVVVQLDAFSATIYGSLQARLDYISADTISETRADGRGQTFYLGRISFLPQQSNTRISLGDIKPGMELTVDIKTGKRSVLTFLAKPIIRAFSGAFNER